MLLPAGINIAKTVVNALPDNTAKKILNTFNFFFATIIRNVINSINTMPAKT